jgi:murein DD-endopeptidase MepM/ murein hydrolase activator NlpD
MPRFHTGGVVPGARGTEVPILAMAGETVTPAGGGGGTTVIQLVLDGQVVTEIVHNGLLRKQRRTPLGLVT